MLRGFGQAAGRGLWGRWVLANTAAELLGLGVAAAVGIAAAVTVAAEPGAELQLLLALVAWLAGGFEGVAVGWAQWLVLRRPLPDLPRRQWLGATVAGALIAWALGIAAGVFFSAMAAEPAAGEPVEPSFLVQNVMAALLGLATGAILGLPQWLVLRRFLSAAGWWVPANSLAWCAGMPLVFLAAGSLPPELHPALIAVSVLATIAVAGATVGAIHGAVLVWLLRRQGRMHVREQAA